MLTSSFLKGLGIIQIDHLFFEMPSAMYLWKLCKLKMGITTQAVGLLQQRS